jgi:hypothetical protein
MHNRLRIDLLPVFQLVFELFEEIIVIEHSHIHTIGTLAKDVGVISDRDVGVSGVREINCSRNLIGKMVKSMGILIELKYQGDVWGALIYTLRLRTFQGGEERCLQEDEYSEVWSGERDWEEVELWSLWYLDIVME